MSVFMKINMPQPYEYKWKNVYSNSTIVVGLNKANYIFLLQNTI